MDAFEPSRATDLLSSVIITGVLRVVYAYDPGSMNGNYRLSILSPLWPSY